jgi:uncharacterized protein with GYD domain
MAKFVFQGSFRGETIAGMIDHPSDRVAAVSKAMEKVGGTLDQYYWVLGEYDFLAIVDASDSFSAAAVSLAVSSTGVFTHTETHELIPAGELASVLEKAKSVRAVYQPPGG